MHERTKVKFCSQGQSLATSPFIPHGAAGLFFGPSPHVIHKYPSFHCLPTQTQLTHLSNLSGYLLFQGICMAPLLEVLGHLSMCFTESCHWPLPGPSHWVPLCFLRSHLIKGPQTRTCKLIQFQIYFCEKSFIGTQNCTLVHAFCMPVLMIQWQAGQLQQRPSVQKKKNHKICQLVLPPPIPMLEPGMDYKLSEGRGIDLGHYFTCRVSHRGQCTMHIQCTISNWMNHEWTTLQRTSKTGRRVKDTQSSNLKGCSLKGNSEILNLVFKYSERKLE